MRLGLDETHDERPEDRRRTNDVPLEEPGTLRSDGSRSLAGRQKCPTFEPTESEFDPDADSDLETQQEYEKEYQHELELIQEKTAKEKAEALKGIEKHW